MSDLTLTDHDIATLTRLGAVLVPGDAVAPSAAEVPGFDALLRSAVKACGYQDAKFRAAIDAIPANADWSTTRAFTAADPSSFDMVSVLITGAYFMSPFVLGRLGYPLERRHPAGIEEFAEEYETGVLDPVISRGPRFRDPRSASGGGS